MFWPKFLLDRFYQCAMKFLGVLLTLISMANCFGPHHPRGPHSHYKPNSSNNVKTKLTQNMQIVNDEIHIKEDMASVVHEPDTSKMTSHELAFYYFKFHDFDNNTKLDGLEMLQAMKHTFHEDYRTASPDTLSSHEFYYYIGLIDRVLDEDDLDGDGYLSYIEYVLGREKTENEEQKF